MVKEVKTPFGYKVKVGGLRNTGVCKYKNKGNGKV